MCRSPKIFGALHGSVCLRVNCHAVSLARGSYFDFISEASFSVGGVLFFYFDCAFAYHIAKLRFFLTTFFGTAF